MCLYALVMLLIVQDVGKFMVQLAWGLRKHISNQVQSDLYTMESERDYGTNPFSEGTDSLGKDGAQLIHHSLKPHLLMITL